MKKRLILKKINLFLFENKDVEKVTLKLKYSKNISIFELKEFFIFYPSLIDIYIKNRKLIFKFNINNNYIVTDEKNNLDNNLLNEKEIMSSYLKKHGKKEPILEEISSILNISYEESFLLKDIIEEFLNSKEEIVITDSLSNSFSYIFKQRLNKLVDPELIINFIKYLNFNILENIKN